MPVTLSRKYNNEGRPYWKADDDELIEAHLSWENEPPSPVKVWLRITLEAGGAPAINMPLFDVGSDLFWSVSEIYEAITDNTALDAQVAQAVNTVIDNIVKVAAHYESEEEVGLTEEEMIAFRIIKHNASRQHNMAASKWEVEQAIDDYFENDPESDTPWEDDDEDPSDYLIQSLGESDLIMTTDDEIHLTSGGYEFWKTVQEADQRELTEAFEAKHVKALKAIRNSADPYSGVISGGGVMIAIYSTLNGDDDEMSAEGEDIMNRLFALHCLTPHSSRHTAVTDLGYWATNHLFKETE